MFTDSEATPARVEMLLDLARSMHSRKFDPSTIQQLLQPSGLPGLTSRSNQYRIVLNAAKDLAEKLKLEAGKINKIFKREDYIKRLEIPS